MSESAIPQQPQRNPLSRLWNDKEARSVIIQIFAFSCIFAFFFFMVRNAMYNLEAIGKDISLDFLWQPSSYDISQSLIEYNSRSTHFRAMIVGILNTLLVAVFRHHPGHRHRLSAGRVPAVEELPHQQACVRLHRVRAQCAGASAYPAGARTDRALRCRCRKTR